MPSGFCDMIHYNDSGQADHTGKMPLLQLSWHDVIHSGPLDVKQKCRQTPLSTSQQPAIGCLF